MEFKDLLIITIGRSFLFGSYLSFNKDQGYLTKGRYYSRYPLYEEYAHILPRFEEKIKGQKDPKVIYQFEIGEKEILDINQNVVYRRNKEWSDNWVKLIKSLDLDDIAYLNFAEEKISFLREDDIYIEEINEFEWEIFEIYNSDFKKLGITKGQFLNYINSTPPLPDSISDYQKSFFLGFKIGSFFANKFNMRGLNSLVISGEYISSGFIDKSGLIQGLRQYSEIVNISFDSSYIWTLLLNDTMDEYKELRYLNKEIFDPEFVILDTKYKNLTKIENGNEDRLHVIKGIQNYFETDSEWYIKELDLNSYGNIYIIEKIDKIFNFSEFSEWYKFYKYKAYKYISLNFEDKYEHQVDLDRDYYEHLTNEKKYFDAYYDLKNYFGDKYEIKVLHGEKLDKDSLIAKNERFVGILYTELKSRMNEIVSLVNPNVGVIYTKRKLNMPNTAKSYLKVIDDKSNKKVTVEINGERIDAAHIFGKQKFTRLKEFKQGEVADSARGYFVKDEDELLTLIEDINIYIPSTILIDTISYEVFQKVAGENMRGFNIFSLVILNGFNNESYNKSLWKKLKIMEDNYVLIDPKESSIYTLNKIGKWNDKTYMYSHPYSRIYTFDDWHLKGEIMYNEKDKKFFRSDSKKIIDVSDFNLIGFNNG